jgi:uncharacterized protein YbjT (DUF2867 family)
MRIILFGSSGMVGQAVLRECLIDPRIEKVLSMVRSTSGLHHAKLDECVHSDFLDFSSLQPIWRGYDACFYCLGVSSAGMNERDYRRVTFDFTLAAGRLLAQLNPTMTFVYVSGAGTDSSERGRSMWARVKGATENALLALPFKAVMFRPGVIIPLHGIRSKTRSYRMFYAATRPLWGLLRAVWPNAVSTSEQVGRAMIAVARDGAPQPIMEARDINRVGKSV